MTPRSFKVGISPVLGLCEVEKGVCIGPDLVICDKNIAEPGKDVWFLMRVHSAVADSCLTERMVGVPMLFDGERWIPLRSEKVATRVGTTHHQTGREAVVGVSYFVASDVSPIGALDELCSADRDLLTAAVTKFMDGKQRRVRETGKGWISWVSLTKMEYTSLEAGKGTCEEHVSIDLGELLKAVDGEASVDPQHILSVSYSTIQKDGPLGGKSDADTGKGQ